MEISSNKSKEEKKDLVTCIKEKLEGISSLKSIFRVPGKLRGENDKRKNVYVPDEICIGPFHRDNVNLKNMEKHKWHYLYTLLSRRPNLEATLNKCVEALRQTEQAARHCYGAPLSDLTGDKFVEMMLLDGCFIIELFFKYAFKSLRRGGDPIFSTPHVLFRVKCNLILLENQIPLIILQSLFEVVPIPIQCTHTLTALAFRFFRNMLPGEREFLTDKFSQEGNHLLDLIHQCYLPSYPKVLSKEAESAKDLECATRIKKYGITFMMFSAKSLLDISFCDGVFEIPPLVTHQFTEVLFANLIALEHQLEYDVRHFTSYALLMKAFVHCEKDVKLFRHLRILVSDDEKRKKKEMCELFGRLCVGVDAKRFFYAGMVEQVNEYKAKRRSWRKALQCTCVTVPTST